MRDRKLLFTVLRAQSGDRAALNALLSSMQHTVYRTARSFVDSNQTAEDVTQEVLLLVCRNLQHLRKASRFRSWVYTITCREARRQAAEMESAIDLDLDQFAAESSTLEAEDANHSLGPDTIRELIRGAPRASRPVLSLHYIDGLSLAEVADVLELPRGTVKSRLAYGLAVLRQQASTTKSNRSDGKQES